MRISRVASLIAALFLVWIEFNSITGFVADRRASHWPSTAGRIIAKEGCLPAYACGISYNYQVAGREFKAQRISFTQAHLPQGWNNDEVREWVDEEFPVGMVVSVRYDPAAPENAALQVGVLKTDYLIGPGVVALILACMIAWGCHSFLRTKASGTNEVA